MSIRLLRCRPVPVAVFDIVVAGVLALAGVWSVWVGPPISDGLPGPRWLLTVFALLLSVPLVWRRSHGLPVVALVSAGLVGLAIASSGRSEGLQNTGVYVAVYSVAAYAGQREAVAGFVVALAGAGAFLLADENVRAGRVGDLWASAFFVVLLVAASLIGLIVHHSRDRKAREREAVAHEQAVEAAAAAERARLAHELHDIVSHNLSVVVLQAAGAQAQGDAGATDALAKIERSGRQALVEMRRLLGVLRSDDGDEHAALTPQPGIADLGPLVENVRAAGLPVTLTVSGEPGLAAPAVQVAVYRIVQEALTNALKHAPGAPTNA